MNPLPAGKKRISEGWLLLALGVLLVVIDQVIKILVKTSLPLGGGFNVLGEWFRILFVENEGMAFGMKFGGWVGKLLLTVFRLALFGALCWWIRSLIRRNDAYALESAASSGRATASASSSASSPVPTGVLVGLTLITAGAFGNIVDSVLYGQIFSASYPWEVATLGGEPYAPLLFGKVVDMFYFPLIDTIWPEWVPWIGGTPLRFFEPVFNFADSCVTVGAFYLILFQYKFFSKG